MSPPQELISSELAAMGWVHSEGDEWQLRWDVSQAPVEVFESLRQGQKINQFPDSRPLSNKCLLHKTLANASRSADRLETGNPYNYAPEGFVMPEDYACLLAAAQPDPDAIWISKPAASSGGRGIELFKDPKGQGPRANELVQRYLSSPHLMDGRKYSLRFFVLVTHLDPLVVYLHGDGLAKFASRTFNADPKTLDDKFIHLTNPDILKNDPQAPDLERISHSIYRARLKQAGVDDALLWEKIRRLISVTFIAARDGFLAGAQRHGLSSEHCFQLFGLDVLIDAALKPWLLECNFGPSLHVDASEKSRWAPLENDTKRSVLRDTINLVFAGQGGSQAHATEVAGAEGNESALRALLDREYAERGQYERLIPGPEASKWQHCYPVPRHMDHLLASDYPQSSSYRDCRLEANNTHHFIVDDHVLLYAVDSSRLLMLNSTAATIWLCCTDGLNAVETIEELRPYADDTGALPVYVRAMIADWVSDGLLRTRPAHPQAETPAIATWTSPGKENRTRDYQFQDWPFRARFASRELEEQLHPALLDQPDIASACHRADVDTLDITAGYGLRTPGRRQRFFRTAELLISQIVSDALQCAYHARECLISFPVEHVSVAGADFLLIAGGRMNQAEFAYNAQSDSRTAADTAAVYRNDPDHHCRLSRGQDRHTTLINAIVVWIPGASGEQELIATGSAITLQELLTSHSDTIVTMDKEFIDELLGWLNRIPCYLARTGDKTGIYEMLERLVQA